MSVVEAPAEGKDPFSTPIQRLQFEVNSPGHPDNAKNGFSAPPGLDSLRAAMTNQLSPVEHPLARIMSGQTGSEPGEPQVRPRVAMSLAAKARAAGNVSHAPADTQDLAEMARNANPRVVTGGVSLGTSASQRAAGKGGRGSVNGIGATTQAVLAVTPQAYGE